MIVGRVIDSDTGPSCVHGSFPSTIRVRVVQWIRPADGTFRSLLPLGQESFPDGDGPLDGAYGGTRLSGSPATGARQHVFMDIPVSGNEFLAAGAQAGPNVVIVTASCVAHRTCPWAPSSFEVRVLLLRLLAPALLRAQTISGTVQDPPARSSPTPASRSLAETSRSPSNSSDGQGKSTSPDLKPGTYSVRVVREGFEALVKTVDLRGPVQLQLTLTIAKQQENISVTGKSLAFR